MASCRVEGAPCTPPLLFINPPLLAFLVYFLFFCREVFCLQAALSTTTTRVNLGQQVCRTPGRAGDVKFCRTRERLRQPLSAPPPYWATNEAPCTYNNCGGFIHLRGFLTLRSCAAHINKYCRADPPPHTSLESVVHCKSSPQASLSRMQLTLHANHRTTHGASRLVRAMSCLVGESPACCVPAL